MSVRFYVFLLFLLLGWFALSSAVFSFLVLQHFSFLLLGAEAIQVFGIFQLVGVNHLKYKKKSCN